MGQPLPLKKNNTMKQLQNNYTTPEQSKRLLELGVPDWTADCVTSRYGGSTFFVQECQLLRRCIDSNNYIPCWSVGRLIEIYFICSFQPEILIDYTMDDLVDYLLGLFESVAMSFSKLED